MIEVTPVSPIMRIRTHVVEKGGFLKAPLSVVLELTNKCNQNCVFCYQSAPYLRPKRQERHLSLDTLGALCRQFEEIEVAAVSLTGGEPTCHPEFIAAVALVKRYDLALSIDTNGTNLTEADIRQLRTILEPERDKLVLSFDAVDKDTYQKLRGSPSFDSFMSTIEYLEHYRISFVTNTLILRENLNQIKDILDLAFRYGVKECRVGSPYLKKQIPVDTYVTLDEILGLHEELSSYKDNGRAVEVNIVHPFMSSGRLPEDISLSHRIPKFLSSCHAGFTSCAIDVFGDVGICQYALDMGAAVGNIYERNFHELWKKVIELRGGKESLPEHRYQFVCPVKASN